MKTFSTTRIFVYQKRSVAITCECLVPYMYFEELKRILTQNLRKFVKIFVLQRITLLTINLSVKVIQKAQIVI